MFSKLKRFFLKKLCKLLIFKIIIINKDSFMHYNRLRTFCEIELNSNIGPIIFVFKEDRRRRSRIEKFLMLKTYLVELKIPENVTPKRPEINEKIIIVIKVALFKVNYEILSEILLDIYVTSILNYIKKKDELLQNKT